jgi:hypothetical protein
MMQEARNLRGAFVPAPDVAITRLPFGGAVLVNGSTLALLECAAPDAEMIAALLATPAPAPAQRSGRGEPPSAVLERTARRLVDEGWLAPTSNGGDER